MTTTTDSAGDFDFRYKFMSFMLNLGGIAQPNHYISVTF